MRVVACPGCRREVRWDESPCRPFCSERCKLLDLAAWATERYRIPGAPIPADPEAGEPDPAARSTEALRHRER